MYKNILKVMICLTALVAVTFADDNPRHIVFEDFVKDYSSTIFPMERDSILENFWRYAKKRGIPYMEENKTDVIFIYRGNDSVKIYGDFSSWLFQMPLRRMADSDLWYIRLSFEPDARLDYKFVVGKKSILDPLNPKVAPSGYGENSELAMPDFVQPVEIGEGRNMAKGTTTTLFVPSKILGYDHEVSVYLPTGYDSSKPPYSVVYFQDGNDYLNDAKATTILNNLISTGSIEPLIAVFVVPPVESKRNQMTEYGMNKLYAEFVATELVPFIDKKYHTQKSPLHRLAVGASFGGLISLFTAFQYPEIISNAASQSGFVSFRNDSLLSLFEQSPPKPLRVYMAVGTYERNLRSASTSSRESDFLMANRRFSKALELKQYQFRYREYHDGHSWGRWRADLPNILRWFFPWKS